MDALTLLQRDHDHVKHLLEELASTTERAEKTRTEGFRTLAEDLTVHETVEEEIFYLALKEHAEARSIVLEAYEEHDVVDAILGELRGTDVSDETWAAKFTVMKENLEHHIEEEEGDMFKKARQIFDDDQLEELGERMRARKDELTTSSRRQRSA